MGEMVDLAEAVECLTIQEPVGAAADSTVVGAETIIHLANGELVEAVRRTIPE